MDYDLWHLFVCSLISTEMIKIMHWKFPQVGGSILVLSQADSDEVSEASSELNCAIFRQTRPTALSWAGSH